MVKRWAWTLGLAFLASLAIAKISYAEDKKHTHEEHAKGPHGGEIVELGEEVAHLEVLCDEKAGKLTMYVLGPDAKTSLAIQEAPKLNIKTKDGNVQVPMTVVEGAATQYTATHDALKACPIDGRVSVKIGDKKYNGKLDCCGEKAPEPKK